MKINVIYSTLSLLPPIARLTVMYLLYIMIFVSGTYSICYGQADDGFHIAPIVGVNFSQLDGD